MRYGIFGLVIVFVVTIAVFIYMRQQKKTDVKAVVSVCEACSNEEEKVTDIKKIVETRMNELSKQPYLASRVTYISDIVEIGPAAIKPALELANETTIDNMVVKLELFESVVEIMNAHKDNEIVKKMIAEIGGYDTWNKHLGSDKNELLIQWLETTNNQDSLCVE